MIEELGFHELALHPVKVGYKLIRARRESISPTACACIENTSTGMNCPSKEIGPINLLTLLLIC